MKEIFEQATIASNSFGIDLTGTFRTASFGGERLEQAPSPSPDVTPGAVFKLDNPM